MSRPNRNRPRDAQADGVLRDLAHGFTPDEAAARNSCSERTVRTIKSENGARLHELRLKYADQSALKLLRSIVDGTTAAPIRERVQAAAILLKFPVPDDEQDDTDGSRTVVGGVINVHFTPELLAETDARVAEAQAARHPNYDPRDEPPQDRLQVNGEDLDVPPFPDRVHSR